MLDLAQDVTDTSRLGCQAPGSMPKLSLPLSCAACVYSFIVYMVFCDIYLHNI